MLDIVTLDVTVFIKAGIHNIYTYKYVYNIYIMYTCQVVTGSFEKLFGVAQKTSTLGMGGFDLVEQSDCDMSDMDPS